MTERTRDGRQSRRTGPTGERSASRLAARVVLGLGCVAALGGTSASRAPVCAAAGVGSFAFGGRLITADGAPPDGLHVVATDATGRYEAIVDSSGVFVGALPCSPTGYVTLRVFSDSAAPRYHPSVVTVSAGSMSSPARIVVIPDVWRVRGGAFDGREVRIDPVRAVSRYGDAAGYWRVTRRGRYPGRPLTWVADSFPVRVAFRHQRGDPQISPNDSAAFWRQVTELETLIGRKLFRPASFEEVDAGADGIFVTVSRGMSAAGRTFITHDETGRIYEALVTVSRREYLGESGVTGHELLHALGFGHTGAWPSVMGQSTAGSESPSVEDVAYAQLYYAISALQRDREADFGILEAARE